MSTINVADFVAGVVFDSLPIEVVAQAKKAIRWILIYSLRQNNTVSATGR